MNLVESAQAQNAAYRMPAQAVPRKQEDARLSQKKPASSELPISREQMELRRLKAVELFQRGFTQVEVARKLGVSRTAASRWHRRWKELGEAALLRTKATGHPAQVNRRDIISLCERLDPELTTITQMVNFIELHFGVRYHRDHVYRLMRSLGWKDLYRQAEANRVMGRAAKGGSA